MNVTHDCSRAVTFLCPGICGKKLCDSGYTGLFFIVQDEKAVSPELCGVEPLLL